jgi:hypothetical protein
MAIGARIMISRLLSELASGDAELVWSGKLSSGSQVGKRPFAQQD